MGQHTGRHSILKKSLFKAKWAGLAVLVTQDVPGKSGPGFLVNTFLSCSKDFEYFPLGLMNL